ncbi:MAG: hypothetical protein HKN47_02400, partial [Pirellulaceae bacterium]|nr:hypothetical protein [Pirellulaceae bacterium]
MSQQTVDGFDEAFDWQRQKPADQLIRRFVDQFCGANDHVANLRDRMVTETGTRLLDWVDHVGIPASETVDGKRVDEVLRQTGFRGATDRGSGDWFVHDGGLFPPICLLNDRMSRMAIRVDSVADFLATNQCDAEIIGRDGAQFRRALVWSNDNTEFFVCQRHGWLRWEPCDIDVDQIMAAKQVLAMFADRQRADFSAESDLIKQAVAAIGVDWACDRFFVAERNYWQSRNHAARVQKERQDRLGLGWGNHDHHTYRNSRENFAALIGCLELLGFHCRERFYAGGQAGWGAQVLEQPATGIVIFADVDLSPEELAGDFAHDGLAAQDHVGTVGLWCELHGEAFLQAGMHHLECQFDFDAARQQLQSLGINTMAPFTDFDYLRQAFTEGEMWKVESSRIDAAMAKGFITADQAERFRREGVVGSHLEILERNEGFKGFNQTGVSEIIRKTDPRHLGQ